MFDVSVIIVVFFWANFMCCFCIEHEYVIKLTLQIYKVNFNYPTVWVKLLKKILTGEKLDWKDCVWVSGFLGFSLIIKMIKIVFG